MNELLRNAVLQQRRLRISYEPGERIVEPHASATGLTGSFCCASIKPRARVLLASTNTGSFSAEIASLGWNSKARLSMNPATVTGKAIKPCAAASSLRFCSAIARPGLSGWRVVNGAVRGV